MCEMLFYSHLVVQVPSLIVLLRAFLAEDGLVVDLDELPFRTVAEVSKKSTQANNTITVNYYESTALRLHATTPPPPLHSMITTTHTHAPNTVKSTRWWHLYLQTMVQTVWKQANGFKPHFLHQWLPISVQSWETGLLVIYFQPISQ